MPTVKKNSTRKITKVASDDLKVFHVRKGSSGAVNKEAVDVYADQHREAMIRLVNW